MERLQKKCLVASIGSHALLLVIFLFGSAFFVARQQPLNLPAIRVVPSQLVDAAISGGGGDPKVAPSEEKMKGETLEPQPVATPPAPPQPAPPKPVPVQPKPSPNAESPKLSLKPMVRNSAKPADKPLKLKPVDGSTQKTAKEDSSAVSRKLAGEIGRKTASLRSGFDNGTAVQISGPGGEAFANYAQWVKETYENAWVVGDDLDDLQSTARVSVTIARNGNVVASKIERRSGNPVLDQSIERTLAKVRFVRPFPAGSTDTERTFTINFNLKAKRAIG